MDAHEYDRLAEYEEWYWWHRARQTIVQTLLRRHAPPHARILDVGCGTGATTRSLTEFGNVVGLDVGMDALRYAQRRGVPVAASVAAPLAVRSEAVDVVVALDVLEHLPDDHAAAEEIWRVLTPGGIVLVTVPAYQFLWSGHDVALGHQRRYRRRQLREVLRAGGFEIELCSYVMASVFPPAAVVRLADRLMPRERAMQESGYVATPPVVNSIMSHVVGFEGRLVQHVNLPFGLSVVAVARRPRGPAGSCV